ncbi:MAG: PadR family transcriptional regulator [Oscillospiraceae bacterium]|nr:PadR family transcriptional regulator [Oscillospiraceae bacterium]
MDTQRKKGLLDVCVLAVLQRGPSYGYKIMNDLAACVKISESTLYPILKRLETNGCVTTHTELYQGRTRKYFTLTGPGREKIADFLQEWDEIKRIYTFIEEESK